MLRRNSKIFKIILSLYRVTFRKLKKWTECEQNKTNHKTNYLINKNNEVSNIEYFS